MDIHSDLCGAADPRSYCIVFGREFRYSERVQLFPNKWDISSYEFLLKDYWQIIDAASVSLFVTVVGTILSLIIMAMYAYPISRGDFPHRNFFSFFMFFTMLFNGTLCLGIWSTRE